MSVQYTQNGNNEEWIKAENKRTEKFMKEKHPELGYHPKFCRTCGKEIILSNKDIGFDGYCFHCMTNSLTKQEIIKKTA